jgi:putative NADH-flavin reductase
MKALIFGATGMVGGEVLSECLRNRAISSVVSIARRHTKISHGKLTEVLHENYLDYACLDDFTLAAFDLVYRLFPFIGIDSDVLARVMVRVGIEGDELKVFENRDLRASGKTLAVE